MLGIIIPYYNNSINSEIAFKELYKNIINQLTDEMILFIYEDGQYSHWLDSDRKNVIRLFNTINMGVSYARNVGLDYLLDKVDYILFLDSDDQIEGNYLNAILKVCKRNIYDIVESLFFINDELKKSEKIRSGVCGSAIKSEIIGSIRFKNNLLIGEDTEFMKELWNNREFKKKVVKVCYFYNLGFNRNSLMMRYLRHEISKENIGGNLK